MLRLKFSDRDGVQAYGPGNDCWTCDIDVRLVDCWFNAIIIATWATKLAKVALQNWLRHTWCCLAVFAFCFCIINSVFLFFQKIERNKKMKTESKSKVKNGSKHKHKIQNNKKGIKAMLKTCKSREENIENKSTNTQVQISTTASYQLHATTLRKPHTTYMNSAPSDDKPSGTSSNFPVIWYVTITQKGRKSMKNWHNT